MATKTATKRSWGLPCPMCGDPEVRLDIDLNDLDNLTCNACSEEFSPAQALAKAREAVAKWEAVCRWIETAPVRD